MEGITLYEGSNQYARYSKLFMKLLKDNRYELNNKRSGDGDIVTHSISKGVDNVVAEGFNNTSKIARRY